MVIGVLILWTFVTYYILLHNSSVQSDTKQKEQQQLKQLLPKALREQSKSLQISDTLVSFLKLRYMNQETSTTPKITIVAAEISNELQEQQPKTTTTTSARIPTKTYLANGEPVIPILVFACNRISVVKCLENLVQYRPSVEQFPIIVSQVNL